MRGTHTQFIVTRSTETGLPLLAFPVQICSAVQSNDVKLERTTPDGGKPKRRWMDEVTGKHYTDGEIRRGVKAADGDFVHISDQQLKAIDEVAAVDGIEVLSTVNLSDVPVERVSGFHYLQAPVQGASLEAYRLMYEAMLPQAQKGQGKRPKPEMAMLVRFQTGSRVKVGVVYSDADREAMVLLTLEYGANVKDPDEAILAPQQVEVSETAITSARTLLEGMRDAVDFDEPVDEAVEMKRQLVEAVAFKGETVEAPESVEVAPPSLSSLDDALEESLAATV